jgi:hypothetical protein
MNVGVLNARVLNARVLNAGWLVLRTRRKVRTRCEWAAAVLRDEKREEAPKYKKYELKVGTR